MLSTHFIGVDAGGTTTRAIVATADGQIVGVGHAPGANTWSSGTSVSKVIGSAVGAAIEGVEPASIAGGVIAVAGAATGRGRVSAEIEDAWQNLGLAGSPDLVTDVVAAYAAGTTAPDGLVLVAGTGSIAAAISRSVVVRRAGGYGWLVGDEGSAVWLGIQGIRAALKAIDGTGSETSLVTATCEHFHIEVGETESIAPRIVAAAHGQPPAQLGQFARAVVAAHDQADPVAVGLIEAAARHLTNTAVAAASGSQPTVVVLAGSLLTKADPIRRLVRADLTERWPAAPITEATSGEAGAAALAIAKHQGTPITDSTLARLCGGVGESG